MNISEIECSAGQRPRLIVDAGDYLVAKVCFHFSTARHIYIEFRYNEVLEQVACPFACERKPANASGPEVSARIV
jgi:hypothetical protein